MSTFRTEGIILRRNNFRENDRIFTVYTKEYGKLSCIAEGVRKLKSKQAGHLEPMTCSRFMFANGRSRRIKLATAVTVKHFSLIRADLHKLLSASYCLELFDRAVPFEEQDAFMYQFLFDALSLLNDVSHDKRDGGLEFFVRSFCLKLMAHLGYKPELLTCIQCNAAIFDDRAVFHSLQGGLIEKRCVAPSSELYLISVTSSLIRLLRMMLNDGLDKIATMRCSAQEMLTLNQIIKTFVATHLERPIRSEVWFERMPIMERV
jgi:DNA repair protein RecO (recombination protein O)